MRRWLLSGCAVFVALCSAPLAAQTYTNGLGFGTDANGQVWNIWSANGSNIWDWQQNYVGGYLHYAFKIHNYTGFYCSGSCRYHNVWSKNPTLGFVASDVLGNDSGLFPESNQNNHKYQVDVQWNAGGYHVSVYDITAGSAYSANDYAHSVNANTYDSWTWGYSLWTGHAYADETASTHASNWTSTIYQDGATGTIGGGGDIRTDALPVVLPPLPTITTQPSNQTVTVGANATFTVAASGTPTPTLQWQVSTNAGATWTNLTNSAPYSGVTSTALTVTAALLGLSGTQYRAVATNGVGPPAISNAAALTVTAQNPTITAQPVNQKVKAGQSARFTVLASGTPTPTYRWERLPAGSSTWSSLTNSGSYSGATTATLLVTGVTASMNGDQFRAVATNVANSATSNAATLTSLPYTYTYTNGLGFGTDVNGHVWNIWSANGSNIWDWQQNYVGRYLHYAFKIYNYAGFYCSGSCRYHNVWDKNPTFGFETWDVRNDSGIFPESNQNNHIYQVDVQWNAGGYHATVYDLTAGSAYSANDYAYSVDANTYDSWTWGYSLWTGQAYADEDASTHASNWTSTIYGDGVTGTSGGGGDVRTDALPVVFPPTPILLPVSISTNGTVSFTCPTGYTVIGYESFKGTYPDTSTHVSTNTLGPTLVCSSVAGNYTMENGYLNGTVPTGDGNYWVRISKEGTAYVNTDFSGEWYYWTAQRVAGVWSIGGSPSTGTISVTTNLSAASFTISGPANYSGSGTSFSQTNAPAGVYTITYGAVAGSTTPSSDTKTLAGGGSISFTGTYTLVPPPTLVVSPLSLSFTYQNGVAGPPQAQTITVSSSGSPLLFTATTSTASGGNWLSVAPGGGTTSAVLSVNVALGLGPGTYSGSINIASAGASNSPRAVPVTMTVTPPVGSGQVLLTVRKNGSGGGTITSSTGEINCGSTCAAALKAGSHVKLEAVADPGSTFVGWSDSFCKGTLKPCSFTISSSQTISATFIQTPQNSINKIIYVGVCGAGYIFDDTCFSGFGWYDPRDAFKWVDPLNDSQLDSAAIGGDISGLDAIGLRIGKLFPTSVTLVTGFSVASAASETVLLNLIKNNAAGVVDFVIGVYNPGDRIYLAGHSAGGGIVLEVADSLRKKGINVVMTAQIDTVSFESTVPTNVARAFNYYYPWDGLCAVFGLTTIVPAKKGGTIVSNVRIDAPLGPDALASFCGGHKNMDNDPLVWRPILDFMVGIP